MEIRGEGGNLPSVSSQVRAEWGKYFTNLFSSEARGQDEGFLSGDVSTEKPEKKCSRFTSRVIEILT